MRIIAHRGYWLDAAEKNTEAAFLRSIEHGFGIETDIRDRNGELIVCHDVPLPHEAYLSFDEFLHLYSKQADKNAVLGINVKSDGLQHLLQAAIAKHQLSSYFVFDMSFPTLYFNYRNGPLKFFTSINEFNRTPALFDECTGIWADAYTGLWYDMSLLRGFLDKGKQVCIVSPELHGREHMELWHMIKQAGLHLHDGCMLCTDHPGTASSFFNIAA